MKEDKSRIWRINSCYVLQFFRVSWCYLLICVFFLNFFIGSVNEVFVAKVILFPNKKCSANIYLMNSVWCLCSILKMLSYLFCSVARIICIDAQERVWSQWVGVPILVSRLVDHIFLFPLLSLCLHLSRSLLYNCVLCMNLLHSGYVKKQINISAQ